MSEVNFGNLYDYQKKNGVVLPITGDIRTTVGNAFKEFFGQDFSVDSTTPQGRMIEAISLLFCDVLRVCAVNANGFNPYQAVGTYLDNIGQMYGVSRMPGESDSSYRKRIIDSSSNGSGYAAALRSALSRVNGVTSVSVLDNGNADPASLPSDAPDGVRVTVDAHSVLICVGGGLDADIINTIFDNISAGCGMQSNGTYAVSSLVDRDGVQKNIVFNRPKDVAVTISVSVRDTMYTGMDILGDTTEIIRTFVRGNLTNRYFTKEDIASAIASAGTGIICSNVELNQDNYSVDAIVISPTEAITLADDAISVEVI